MKVSRRFAYTFDREALMAALGVLKMFPKWNVDHSVNGDSATVTLTCEDDVFSFGTWVQKEGFVPVLGLPDSFVQQAPAEQPTCEVCDTKRHKKTYWCVTEISSRWVGKTCLSSEEVKDADVESGERVHSSLLSTVEAVKNSPHFDVLRVVAEAFRAVHECPAGYVSRRQSEYVGYHPTGFVVRERLERTTPEMPVPSETGQFLVVAAVAQASLATYSPTKDNEEEVKYLLSRGTVSIRNVGMLAQTPLLYKREEERNEAVRTGFPAPTDDYDSGYVGTVGERLTVNVRVDEVRAMESYFLVRMRTRENLALVWFTGNPTLHAGDFVTITATVKRHSEFRGTTSTQVNRCREAPQAS